MEGLDIGGVDIGTGAVELGVLVSGVVGGVAGIAGGVDGALLASGVTGLVPGGVAAGAVPAVASGVWAKAPGAAAASMAATALARAKRCKFVRVDMGGKAPFYKNRSQIAVAAEIDIG